MSKNRNIINMLKGVNESLTQTLIQQESERDDYDNAMHLLAIKTLVSEKILLIKKSRRKKSRAS